MAYNDSPDNEFDQEMERLLHEHFDAEDSTLLAPDDPWEWLESRMEEPSTPSFFSRLLGFMNPKREGRLPPAFAVAGGGCGRGCNRCYRLGYISWQRARNPWGIGGSPSYPRSLKTCRWLRFRSPPPPNLGPWK